MNETSGRTQRGHEAGFALVLAILSLMLLTFLGLTLATSSSTELQIATNYRWSQQALYNAEAGMEHAKLLLAQNATPAAEWQPLLPQARPGSWPGGAAPAPIEPLTAGGRDYENAACDVRGGTGGGVGMGYGRVLTVPVGGPMLNVTSIAGGALRLNGAYTIWVRRELVPNSGLVPGQFSDRTDNNIAVVTVEGVAPYVAQGVFARANQAVRVLELTYSLDTSAAGDPCGGFGGQKGLGPTGDNFDNCSSLGGGAAVAATFTDPVGRVEAAGDFGAKTDASTGGVVQ
jgi:hypothetical protein